MPCLYVSVICVISFFCLIVALQMFNANPLRREKNLWWKYGTEKDYSDLSLPLGKYLLWDISLHYALIDFIF